MSVIARGKTSSNRLRRLREMRPSAGAAVTAPAPRSCETADDHARSRTRQASRPQDEALYTCTCGFVFAAPVSASVGCPHCGDSLAW
jgi:hypothetical protein